MIEIPPKIRLFGGFDGTETKRDERNWYKNPTFIDGYVTDTEYNSGLIVRERNGKEICTFGIRKTGDDLIDAYQKGTA